MEDILRMQTLCQSVKARVWITKIMKRKTNCLKVKKKTKYLSFNVCNKFKMNCNVVFHSPGCPRTVYTKCITLECVSIFKYLGITLDQHLKRDQHTNNIAKI
jgi:hypothetical protein